jgi:hypothetical protein
VHPQNDGALSRCGVNSIRGLAKTAFCAAPPKASGFPDPLYVLGHSATRGKTGEGLYMTTGHNDVDHAPPQNGATLVDRGRPCIWIRVDAELTVITISGEIDASDIDDMSPYARRLVRDSGVLIIDLSGVDFITVGGLRALLTLWSADPATTESPRAHVMRICSEHMTVELRRGG